jgi:hypothetical protein
LKSLEAVQVGQGWHVLAAEYRMTILSYILRYVSVETELSPQCGF